MKQRPRLTRRLPFRPEGLEPRSLLTAGALAGLNLVEDLGEVSKASAIKGVEVTAPIPSGGSVTFQFGAEAAGNYTLKVRYTGEGLALEAQGPSGKAAITPGPAGPFATVHLPLEAASYAITATALGDRPAFVDWELLLDTGVGQGPVQSSSLVGSSASIPLPSSSSPASPISSPSTPAPASAISFSTAAFGGLLGRAEPVKPIAPVGPTAPGGSLSMAYAGEGLPEGVLRAEVRVASESPAPTSGDSPTMALGILGDVERDEAALADSSWFDRVVALAAWPTPGPASGADRAGIEIGVEAPASEPDQPRAVASTPGLIAGVAVSIAVVHRWRPRVMASRTRRGGPSNAITWPLSMGLS